MVFSDAKIWAKPSSFVANCRQLISCSMIIFVQITIAHDNPKSNNHKPLSDYPPSNLPFSCKNNKTTHPQTSYTLFPESPELLLPRTQFPLLYRFPRRIPTVLVLELVQAPRGSILGDKKSKKEKIARSVLRAEYLSSVA